MTLFDSGVPYTRLISASSNGQRYRMMRYVMVLGIILVTIFLYVSYYTTPMSAVDGRYSSGYMPNYLNSVSTQEGAVQETRSSSLAQAPPLVVLEGRGSVEEVVPSSGTKKGESESSNRSKSGDESAPVKKEETEAAVGTVLEGAGGAGGGGVEVQKVAENENHVSSNLTAELEQKAKANTTIVIPKVEVPAKQEVLSKLVNTTKTVPLKAEDPSHRNQLTNEIYEAGFTSPIPDLCPNNGQNIQLLALVHSAPSHQQARFAIRQTWGHFGSRKDISIGFLVGKTNNASWEESLQEEQAMYADIVRSNSFDSYDNLTLKTISMLEWTVTYCSEAKFLLKVDDDMFINVPKLLDFVHAHQNDKRQIYGRLAKKWRPIRNKKSKYYVSPALYAPKNFPDFVTGPSYLLTTDMLRELFEASLSHAFLKLEDVYMTGIISESVGVKRRQVNEFLNRRIAFNPCAVRKAISIHMVKGKEQFDLWKKLLDVDLKCK